MRTRRRHDVSVSRQILGSLTKDWKKRLRKRAAKKQPHSRISVEKLEDRNLLALVAADFDVVTGSSPAGWHRIGDTSSGTTFSNLDDVAGGGTTIDLTITETGDGNGPNDFCGANAVCAASATINASTLPDASLAGVDGQIFTDADPLTLTWSGLTANQNYEVYVFGLEGLLNDTINHDVTITGAGTATSFTQSFDKNQLFINDAIGSSANNLGDYAQVIQSDANGEIEIAITPRNQSVDVSIGGVAIQELAAPALTLTIAADSVSEGDGPQATTATVSRNTADISLALTVDLVSNDTTAATVPAQVIIPAGSRTSDPFDIAAVDDAIVDGTQTATITASASGLADGTDTLDVTDDDAAALTLTIAAAAVSEADGAAATTATVSRNTDTTSALNVTLSSSDSNSATVQTTVEIPAGSTTSLPFDIDAVNEGDDDGLTTVTITATAASHTDGTDSLDVVDDDVVTTLTIAVAATSIDEGDGAIATTGTASLVRGGITVERSAREARISDGLSSAEHSSNTDAGSFDVTFERTNPAPPPAADEHTVAHSSNITEDGLEGDFAVIIDDDTPYFQGVNDETSIDVFFAVTSPLSFALTGQVFADENDGFASASVRLTGPGVSLSFIQIADANDNSNNGGQTNIDENGTLAPGLYRFESVVEGSTPLGQAAAEADANFSLSFVAAPLTVTLASDDTSEATVPADVTIAANQSTSPAFDVAAIEDAIVDGTQTATITGSAAGFVSGSDTVDVTDNEVAGFVVTESGNGTSVPESGAPTDDFTVALTFEPLSNVEISIVSANTDEVTISPATLTFTPSNWMTAQTVTVTGEDDQTVDGDVTTNVTVSVNDANSDALFHNVASQDVVVTTTDDDGAGFTVSESQGSTVVSEDATTDTFEVVLDARPLTDVVFTVTSSDTDEATVSPATLTFKPADWDQPQEVTVTGVDDDAVDGFDDTDITIAVDAGQSDDAFDSLPNQTVVARTNDNDTADFTITETQGSTSVDESGTTDTFDVVLTRQPLSDVVFNVTSNDTDEATVSPATLTFTTTNWNTAQTVTVTGEDDDFVDGSTTPVLTVAVDDAASNDAFDGLSKAVNATTTDDDVAGIVVAQTGGSTTVSELGTTDKFTVKLAAAPLTDVVLNISSADVDEANVSPTTLTFTSTNWDTIQEVDVTGVDDQIVDGSQNTQITISVDNALSNDAFDNLSTSITATTTDDDGAGVSVTESEGATIVSETGTTDSFDVKLTSQPLTDVVLDIVSQNTNEATVDLAQLTFTNSNWNDAQTVTVTGEDDTVVDGNQLTIIDITVNAGLSDDVYDNVTPPTVTVETEDDDDPGITITEEGSGTSVHESGTTDTFSVRLDSQPASDVVLNVVSTDLTEGTVDVPSLTFTTGNWDTPQVVTLTGQDDFIIDGAPAYSINVSVNAGQSDDGYDNVPQQTVSASTTDDDVAGFTVVESDGFTLVFEDGSTDTFTVTLDAQPDSNVVIDISSGDPDEATVSPSSLTFTPVTWDDPQTVIVTGAPDTEVDGNQSTTVTLSVDASASDDNFDAVSAQTVTVITADLDGSISGTVWEDADGNQVQNGNEAGLANVEVYLDLDRDGQHDTNEPIQVTNSNGEYTFPELAPGEYVVAQVVPQGLAQTFPEVLGTAGTYAQLINDTGSLPVFGTFAPRDVSQLFVVEKNSGNIRILDLETGTMNATPFLTIGDVDASANEAGLLGLAFHPDYANNGLFYVNVTIDNAPTTNFATHIREYRVSADPDVALPNPIREIISYDQPFGNHNGGWIGFSPNDNYLYIASGDGGSGGDPLNSGQSLDTLLGKMLRVDVNGDDFPADPARNYAVPPSNPFVGVAGVREEIWAWGLRNPWRDSFDRQTGDLWIADVGQNAREEINFQPAASAGGENYAWNRREGFLPFNGGQLLPGDVEPVYDYQHGSGTFQGNSVIGGFVYRGPIGALQGSYIFADSRSSNVWAFDPADPINTVQRINDVLVPDFGSIGGGPIPDDIVSFSEDASGNLYMVEIDGEIHKISMRLPGTHTVIVEGGEAVTDVDFGNQDPALSSISNFVWDDLNANGVQDNGEPGIDDVTVRLYANGSTTATDTTTTANGGQYVFNGLMAGSYVVEFVAPTSYLFSPADDPVGDLLDSDADPLTGRTDAISLAASSNIDTVDAGMYRLATIGDRVWDDLDGNGLQDNGEPGLDGVSVQVLGNVDDFQLPSEGEQNWVTAMNLQTPFRSEIGGPTGDGDGHLRAESTGGGGPGSRLVIRNLTQWATDLSQTEAIEADLTNLDTTNLTIRIAVNGPGGWFASTNAASLDLPAGTGWTRFSFSLDPADLTNLFESESANEGGTDLAATLANLSELRILHNDQPNFRGDSIDGLLGVDNITQVVASSITANGGLYGLIVPPGTYRPRFALPSGRIFSPQDVGNDDTIDSDVDAAGQTAPITVVSGDQIDTLDAGTILPTIRLEIDGDSILESGGTLSGTVTRNTDATFGLTVGLLSSSSADASVPSSVTIGATELSAPFTVTIQEDDIDEVTETITITGNAANHLAGTDSFDILDNDTAGVTLSKTQLEVAESGTTDNFTVVLDTQPVTDVVITLTRDDTTEAVADATSLTFTPSNWDDPQLVTVTGLDDDLDDGDQTTNFSVAVDAANSDDAFDNIPAQTVVATTTDDDTAGFTVSKTTVTVAESGTTDTFTVRLDAEPESNVVIDLSLDDQTEVSLDTSSLTFTPQDWDDPQTVTVTGLDDNLDDGDQTTAITLVVNAAASDDLFDNLGDQEVTATTTDDDDSGFMVSKTTVTVDESGTTESFTVKLTAEPVADVVLHISSADEDEAEVSVSTLTFTPNNYNDPQTVTVTGVDDPAVDGDQQTDITISVDPEASDPGFSDMADQVVVATTTDDDEAGLIITLTENSTEVSETGTSDTFLVRLAAQPLSDVTLDVTSDDPGEVTVNGAPLQLLFTSQNWNQDQVVTVTGEDDLLVDGDIVSTVSVTADPALSNDAFDQVTASVAVLTEDDEVAGFTVAVDGSLEVDESGTTDTFTVVLDGQPLSDVVIDVTSGDTDEASVSPGSLTFTPQNWNQPQTITVKGEDDTVVDGPQQTDLTLAINPGSSHDAFDNVESQSVVVVTTDDEVAGFTIRETASGGSTRVSEDETTDEFFVVLNAEPLSDVVFDVSSSDLGEATVAPTRLTFTPDNWNTEQQVTVTGVDDPIVDGDILSTTTVSIDPAASNDLFDNLAPGEVTVVTEDNDVPTLTVTIETEAVTEGDENPAAFGVVSRNTDTSGPLLVALHSDDTSEATVPDTVEIEAGETSATFPINAEDDDLVDGSQTVTITPSEAGVVAAASNFQSVSDTIVVHDNEGADLEIVSIETSATWAHKALPKQEVKVGGTFSGGGPNLKAIFDWGDGSQSEGKIDRSTGTYVGLHRYSTGGIFVVTVTLSDSAGGEDSETIETVVTGVRLTPERVLQIVGSNGRDQISISERVWKIRVLARFDGQRLQRFAFKSRAIKAIEIHACEGNDGVSISRRVRQPATVFGGGGNDTIRTGRGNDTIDGGPGRDTIYSDRGNDTITDKSGHNRIFSGSGHDVVHTGDGFDRIWTESGNDLVHSGGGGDIVIAGSGHDTVNAGGGNDYVDGGSGNDLLRGGAGHDVLNGGSSGHDILLGETGNDWLFGGHGRDLIIGGLGVDGLFGGSGDDVLIGGVTDHDSNDSALKALLKEWSARRSYNTRVNNLRTGGGSLNGIKLAAQDTVDDDNVRDRFWGGSGRDFFFADLDRQDGDDDWIRDRRRNERLDLI